MLIQVITIQMRGVLLMTAILSASLVGCRDRTINRDDLIGRFEYRSGDKPQGTTCFVLNSDGGYALGDANAPLGEISMSGTPPRGTWKLSFNSTGQELIIGKSGLPVQLKGSSIRVTVNDDLGMYCDLPRRR
jgi:hypothetical protein